MTVSKCPIHLIRTASTKTKNEFGSVCKNCRCNKTEDTLMCFQVNLSLLLCFSKDISFHASPKNKNKKKKKRGGIFFCTGRSVDLFINPMMSPHFFISLIESCQTWYSGRPLRINISYWFSSYWIHWRLIVFFIYKLVRKNNFFSVKKVKCYESRSNY